MTKITTRPLKLPTKSKRLREESKALWNRNRSAETADFYTFGYEGRTTDELIDALKSVGVKSVLDIRYNPVSMYRPELSKSNLQRMIGALGLDYFHVRDWGIPRHVRARAIDSGTRDTIWEWYDKWVVAPFFERNLHLFMNQNHPVAMMCMECDPVECHRHRIFLALERQGLRGFDL